MSIFDAVQATMAVASFPTALGAWAASRRSEHHADRSAQAAAAQTEIERQREHRALFPGVQINCVRDPGATTWKLVVHLEGPDALDHLDSFTVTIRDDGKEHTRSAGSKANQGEFDEQIWGPYKLKPRVGGADGLGRTSVASPLNVGERWIWYIEKTAAPSWVEDMSWWESDYADTPIRLTLTCKRDGFEPWILRREIPQPPEDNPHS